MRLNHVEHQIERIERLPRTLTSAFNADFKVVFQNREALEQFLEIVPRALTWDDAINLNEKGKIRAEVVKKALLINQLGYALVGAEDFNEFSCIIREYPIKPYDEEQKEQQQQ